jgi:hypothetical protein
MIFMFSFIVGVHISFILLLGLYSYTNLVESLI